MWREKEGLFALGCCSSKSRETGGCTGHQLSDTAKQLSLSKSELPLKLVNMEQEKTLCTTRIPREVFKLKGSKPGQISLVEAPILELRVLCRSTSFQSHQPFPPLSLQGPYTNDLCFQSTLIFTVSASVSTFSFQQEESKIGNLNLKNPTLLYIPQM